MPRPFLSVMVNISALVAMVLLAEQTVVQAMLLRRETVALESNNPLDDSSDPDAPGINVMPGKGVVMNVYEGEKGKKEPGPEVEDAKTEALAEAEEEEAKDEASALNHVEHSQGGEASRAEADEESDVRRADVEAELATDRITDTLERDTAALQEEMRELEQKEESESRRHNEAMEKLNAEENAELDRGFAEQMRMEKDIAASETQLKHSEELIKSGEDLIKNEDLKTKEALAEMDADEKEKLELVDEEANAQKALTTGNSDNTNSELASEKVAEEHILENSQSEAEIQPHSALPEGAADIDGEAKSSVDAEPLTPSSSSPDSIVGETGTIGALRRERQRFTQISGPTLEQNEGFAAAKRDKLTPRPKVSAAQATAPTSQITVSMTREVDGVPYCAGERVSPSEIEEAADEPPPLRSSELSVPTTVSPFAPAPCGRNCCRPLNCFARKIFGLRRARVEAAAKKLKPCVLLKGHPTICAGE